MTFPFIIGASQQKRSGRPFIIKVNYASGFTVTLGLSNGYNYNFVVDWGDGAVGLVTAYNDSDRVHTYASGGTYTVTMTGTIEAFNGGLTGIAAYLISVEQWGRTGMKYMTMWGANRLVYCKGKLTSSQTTYTGTFYQCTSLASVETDDWDISNVTAIGGDISSYMGMFSGCTNLTTVNTSNWNTSNMVNIAYVFNGCSKLTTGVDVSGWDMSKCTSHNSAFNGCSLLSSIGDASDFVKSASTKLNSTFSGCASLTSIDTSGWDTSNVTNMSSTFSGCGISSIDVSYFNTDKVTTMGAMFWRCPNLTTISNATNLVKSVCTNLSMFCGDNTKLTTCDVSGWDTSGIVYFGGTGGTWNGAFGGCSAMTSFDISGWVTTSAKYYGYCFAGCSKVTTFGDTSDFVTSACLQMTATFSGCSKVTTINTTNWDTSNVTSFYATFNGCTLLSTLDVSVFDLFDCTNCASMFAGCATMTSFDVSSWVTTTVVNFSQLFWGCSTLTTVTGITNLVTSTCTTVGSMFYHCYAMGDLDLTGWDVSNITAVGGTWDFSGLFCAVGSENIDISGWDLSKCISYRYMFASCANLLTVDMSNVTMNTTSNVDMGRMFYGSSKLTTVYNTGWNTSKVTTFAEMFSGATKVSTFDETVLDLSSCTSINQMFVNNSVRTSFDFSGWDMSKITDSLAFIQGCSVLTSISFPNSLPAIGQQMCYGCSELLTVTVGTGVTAVGANAFYGCNKITTYNFYPSTSPTVSGTPFPARGSSAILHVPTGSSSYNTSPWNSSTYFAQPISFDL